MQSYNWTQFPVLHKIAIAMNYGGKRAGIFSIEIELFTVT